MLGLVLTPVVLALALSLDGFGAGITYGIRKTRIPLLSVLIISMCSGLVLCISMQAGSLLEGVLSPDSASFLGALILILLGGWSLIQGLIGRGTEDIEPDEDVQEEKSELHIAKNERVFTLEIRKLGLVIQILKSPSRADLDRSGSISAWEAMLLGIALSLDAFGAGLGAAMMGLSPWLTSGISAFFCGMFLILGMKTGFKAASARGIRFISLMPALLLIGMGIMKLL
ncbi:sporulation membrane protein YtaF [Paenibacillus lemnae]|uniref:sporulation membrane protein YtaF n=1 Tax=Paenibacillus lemnae TaxID=1330551 RepID=UPI0031B5FCA7